MHRTLVLAGLLSAALTSNALALTAGELLNACLAVYDTSGVTEESVVHRASEMATCAGYIGGITDMNAMFVGLRGVPGFFCLPAEGITGDQSIRVVIKHLEAHPENHHLPARTEALIALAKGFQCES